MVINIFSVLSTLGNGDYKCQKIERKEKENEDACTYDTQTNDNEDKQQFTRLTD